MNFIISFLGSLLANLLIPVLSVIGIRFKFSGSFPRIYGDWVARYTEPTEKRISEEIEETIEIYQFLNNVYGIGITKKGPDRKFLYRAKIKRNALDGIYKKSGTKQLGGQGVFQLKISSDDKSMSGYCVWYDNDTDKIEYSKYEWEKIYKN